MAVVNVTIMRAGASSLRGDMPVFSGPVLSSENVTSIVASAQSSGSISDRKDIFRIATDTAIYIKFGTNPTASAGNDIMVFANTVYEHGGLNEDDVVAIIAV